jgi:hypothetical protein
VAQRPAIGAPKQELLLLHFHGITAEDVAIEGVNRDCG